MAFKVQKVNSDKKENIDGDNNMVSLIKVYHHPEEGSALIKKRVDSAASQSHGTALAEGDFNLLLDANLNSKTRDKQL